MTELEEKFREKEKQDELYCRFRFDMMSKSVEAGRKNKRNCQKCGGERFIPHLSYETKIHKDLEGNSVKYKEWCYAVSICECIRRDKRYKTEPADEKEMKKVFNN